MSHEHVTPRTGESAPFHFDDRWTIDAGVEQVWAVLEHVAEWPQWWPGLTAAEPVESTRAQDPAGGMAIVPGSRAHLRVRAPIGWSLRFSIEVDQIDAPHFIRLQADGHLRGEGLWTLTEREGLTVIDAMRCVTTTRGLIRAMRPLSGLMHAVVMRAGERGLRSRLAGRSQA